MSRDPRTSPRRTASEAQKERGATQDDAMPAILVPVDGSESSHRAVRFVIGLHPKLAPLQVRLLYVHLPKLGAHTAVGDQVAERDAIAHAVEAMRSPRRLLDAAQVPYVSETRRGHIPQAIAHCAKDTKCCAVVMGTRGMGTTDRVLGSVARQVINLVDVPVTLVK